MTQQHYVQAGQRPITFTYSTCESNETIFKKLYILYETYSVALLCSFWRKFSITLIAETIITVNVILLLKLLVLLWL